MIDEPSTQSFLSTWFYAQRSSLSSFLIFVLYPHALFLTTLYHFQFSLINEGFEFFLWKKIEKNCFTFFLKTAKHSHLMIRCLYCSERDLPNYVCFVKIFSNDLCFWGPSILMTLSLLTFNVSFCEKNTILFILFLRSTAKCIQFLQQRNFSLFLLLLFQSPQTKNCFTI